MTEAIVIQRINDQLSRDIIDLYEQVDLNIFGNGRMIAKHIAGSAAQLMETDPRGRFPREIAPVNPGEWVTFLDRTGNIVNILHLDQLGEIGARYIQLINR